jgi:hypothetical protein
VEDLNLNRETSERRLLEIRLMHHFVTSTVQSDFLSTHDRVMIEVWLIVAPTLALEHPFLMNAILSISALHIFKMQPDDTDMLNNHQIYFNAALSQHREAVQGLSAANVSSLTFLFGTAQLQKLPLFSRDIKFTVPDLVKTARQLLSIRLH